MRGHVNSLLPRSVREVPPPLGLYFRPGLNDHWEFLKLFAENHRDFSGLVFDAALDDRQDELRQQTLRRGLDAILDTRAMELATPGGFTGARTSLLWAGQQPHRPVDLQGPPGEVLITKIGRHVERRSYTSVLAPSHYVTGPNDPWLPVDRDLTRELRRCLPDNGRGRVALYYPLAVPGKVLRDPESRDALKHFLESLPIDAIWLRVNGFGSDCGSVALAGYIEACRDLSSLGFPIVAEKSGTVGLALLALGAAGGIESGVTIGETCNIAHLLRLPSGKGGFAPSPRVYIGELQMFLDRHQARELFDLRALRSLACRETHCCRHGAADMIGSPRRHFLMTRMSEVSCLSQVPPAARPTVYLDDLLRPATDRVMRALRQPLTDGTRRRLERKYRILESWRQTLARLARAAASESFAQSSHRHIETAASR